MQTGLNLRQRPTGLCARIKKYDHYPPDMCQNVCKYVSPVRHTVAPVVYEPELKLTFFLNTKEKHIIFMLFFNNPNYGFYIYSTNDLVNNVYSLNSMVLSSVLAVLRRGCVS